MIKNSKHEEREWLREQLEKYVDMYDSYQKYAQLLQEVLKKTAKKHAPLAIVQVRVKSIASFAEKALRKRFKYRYPVNQITDLCGARVITPTMSEVNAVCEFIKQNFDVDWNNSLDVSQRLKPSEFGYRSICYVIKFKPDAFYSKDKDFEVPQEVFKDKYKAEIQVKTLLEHTWAVFSHDRSYKGAFTIPDNWERELATLAAILEDADKSFGRIQEGLQRYEASYETYMTKEQMHEKMDHLEIILEYDPKNVELAARIGKLAITLGDMQKAIDVLSRYVDTGYPPILRDLGVATCKLHKANRKGKEYQQGQKYLEDAIAKTDKDTDAIASLAGTWKKMDENKARELYRQAYKVDPTDPYPLGNYLEYEIIRQRDISMLHLLRPVIDKAIQRCHDQADVGMNLPWAFYHLGKLYLFLGMPNESFEAYARAVRFSTATFMIDTSLESLDKLIIVQDALPGLEWARRLLLLGYATKAKPDKKSDKLINRVKTLKSTEYGPIQGPVVIVVGGCDEKIEQEMQKYRPLMMEAFRDYKGTIISGGTTSGISGLVGYVGGKYSDNIKTVGYITKEIPVGMSVDERYNEIRRTKGDGPSPLEPLQYWIDFIASGIPLSQARLLGIDGGSISAIEYRIALALGIPTAVIQDSGHEAEKLLNDYEWSTSKMLISFPKEANTLRAFFEATFIVEGSPKMTPDNRERIAQTIHEDYLRTRASSVHSEDPVMVDWEDLLDNLKESNRQQADHIFEKLSRIGCTAVKVTDRDVSLMKLTKDEIEILAEMEHARWNGERLLDGWIWAEEEDIIKKTSPYLVGWSDLPEDVKELDRETVRKIPEFLAKIGLEIRRKR